MCYYSNMAKRKFHPLTSIQGGVLRPREHRVLDFCIVGVLAVASIALGFDGLAYFAAFGLAIFHMSLTNLTSFTHDNVVPLWLHGLVEILAVPALLLLVLLADFGESIEVTFYVASAVLMGLVWLISDYNDSSE